MRIPQPFPVSGFPLIKALQYYKSCKNRHACSRHPYKTSEKRHGTASTRTQILTNRNLSTPLTRAVSHQTDTFLLQSQPRTTHLRPIAQQGTATTSSKRQRQPDLTTTPRHNNHIMKPTKQDRAPLLETQAAVQNKKNQEALQKTLPNDLIPYIYRSHFPNSKPWTSSPAVPSICIPAPSLRSTIHEHDHRHLVPKSVI